MYKKTVLDNGLRVITHSIPDRESVGLGIWIGVGGRYEEVKNKGISHFLEHLLFKGTKKYSANRIKQSIEGVGGSLNGFTSEEFTCYYVKVPSKYLSRGLDVLSDMVLNPTLPKDEIEKERYVILEEIKMHKDLPQSYVHEVLDGLLWPRHPLGMSILGTFESVGQIKREDLFKIKEKYHYPQNLVIAACGNLSHKELLENIERLFCSLPKSKKAKFSVFSLEKEGPRVKILSKDTEQTHLAIGLHGLKREHPQKYILSLLNIILGANMSSRLFCEVREKRGLAYEIGSSLKRFNDTGAFIIHAGMDNKKVYKGIEVILKELNKLKKDFVKKDELRRAKEYFLGQLSLALEDTLDHMFWIGEATMTLNKIYSIEEVKRGIKGVSLEDLIGLARNLFNQNSLNLALIGPNLDESKILGVACLP